MKADSVSTVFDTPDQVGLLHVTIVDQTFGCHFPIADVAYLSYSRQKKAEGERSTYVCDQTIREEQGKPHRLDPGTSGSYFYLKGGHSCQVRGSALTCIITVVIVYLADFLFVSTWVHGDR